MHIDNIYFSLSELLRSDTLQYTDQEYDSGRLGSTHSFGPIPRSFPVHCFLLDSHQHRQCLQWLRLCTVSIPGWGTKNLMLHGQKKKNPVSLPGKSHGQWSLVGYSPWCHKELDMPEWLNTPHGVGDAHPLAAFVAEATQCHPQMGEHSLIANLPPSLI